MSSLNLQTLRSEQVLIRRFLFLLCYHSFLLTCLIKQRDKSDLFLLLRELVLTTENCKYVCTIFLSPCLLLL